MCSCSSCRTTGRDAFESRSAGRRLPRGPERAAVSLARRAARRPRRSARCAAGCGCPAARGSRTGRCCSRRSPTVGRRIGAWPTAPTSPAPRRVLERSACVIRRADRTASVDGTRGRRRCASPTAVLDCGNSGTTMRMLGGLARRAGRSCRCSSATSRSSQRPMRRVVDPLRGDGRAARRARPTATLAPLTVRGGCAARSCATSWPSRAAGEDRARARRAPGRRRDRDRRTGAEPRPHRADARRARRAGRPGRRPHRAGPAGAPTAVRARRARRPVVGRVLRGRGAASSPGSRPRARGREPEPGADRVRRRAAAHGRAHRGRASPATRSASRSATSASRAAPLHGTDDRRRRGRSSTSSRCSPSRPRSPTASPTIRDAAELRGEGERPHRHASSRSSPSSGSASRPAPTAGRSAAARRRARR